MTMTRRSFDSTPQPAELPVEFLVIGGGITGLTCAIALRRVGHQVTVLEKSNSAGKSSHGLRMPPNLSRIFNHWGLREEVREVARKMGTMNFLIQSTGELLGTHVWDEELLKEARGEFLFTRYCDMHGLLHKIALRYGAKIRTGAHAMAVDPEEGTVTLSSGEVLTAQVIVGADGVTGITRQALLASQDDGLGSSEQTNPPIALSMYSTAVPREQMAKEPDLERLFHGDETPLYVWLGESRMVYGFPTNKSQEFAMDIYGPTCDCEGRWEESVAPSELLKVLKPCESRLSKLGKIASSLVSYPMAEQPELEDWIEGRLVLIGEAAHPIPVGPGSTQRCAMAVEDGAVLAKLFSHLRTEDQVESFLWAFQDLRQPRCQSVSRQEVEMLQYFTLEGEAQEERNKGMRDIRDAGGYLLDVAGGGDNLEWAETGWAELKELYGYDAEDEADNWWVEWGLLRERAKGNVETGFNFANIQITEN